MKWSTFSTCSIKRENDKVFGQSVEANFSGRAGTLEACPTSLAPLIQPLLDFAQVLPVREFGRQFFGVFRRQLTELSPHRL